MISNKFLKTYTIKRDLNGEERIKGKRVPDKWDEFTIRASVQPLRPDEALDESPGGERNRHGMRIYTRTKLNTADDGTGFKADRIIIDNEEFEIQTVEDWTKHSLRQKHFKCTCWKINSDQRGQ